MKNIFLVLLLNFFILTTFGQTIFQKEDLPQYYIQNGDTIGILLTVEQVQKLDNNTELLTLFEKLSIKCDSLDTYYVKVINNMNDKIGLLDVKIGNITEQNKKQDDIITKLKEQILIKESQLGLCEKQRSNDSTIIKDLKKDLRKSKFKNILGWSAMGVLSTIIITLGILVGIK